MGKTVIPLDQQRPWEGRGEVRRRAPAAPSIPPGTTRAGRTARAATETRETRQARERRKGGRQGQGRPPARAVELICDGKRWTLDPDHLQHLPGRIGPLLRTPRPLTGRPAPRHPVHHPDPHTETSETNGRAKESSDEHSAHDEGPQGGGRLAALAAAWPSPWPGAAVVTGGAEATDGTSRRPAAAAAKDRGAGEPAADSDKVIGEMKGPDGIVVTLHSACATAAASSPSTGR